MSNGTNNDVANQSTDVAAFLRVLHRPGDVFEVRAPKCPEKRHGKFTSTAAGYFNVVEAVGPFVQQLESLEPDGIYVTLNPVTPALLARSVNTIKAKAESTTADADILCRRCLMLDLDPKRPAKISSTGNEMQAALELAQRIQAELAAECWPAPLVAMSGNGAYLLYRIDLPNNEAATELVKRVLAGLAARYDSDLVTVDTSTFNAARIIKLLGTMARKGSHLAGVAGIEDRPHRRSWFIPPAGELEVVSEAQLQAVAEPAKPVAAEPPHKQNGRAPRGGKSAIERCRKYVAKLDKAVEGNKGSNPTLQAACECFRWGLSDAQAAELMAEWNVTHCSPQWSEKELAHKITDARAKVEAAGEVGIRLTHRPAKTTIANEAGDETPAWDNLPEIKCGPDELRVTSETITALADRNDIYQRGGVLVEVREAGEPPPSITRPEGGTRAVALPEPRLRELIADSAVFTSLKIVEDVETWVRVYAPQNVVKQVAARGHYPGIPNLQGIVSAPQFLHDGDILAAPGYHERSGLFFAAGCKFAPVPMTPTLAEIKAAREALLEVYADFPCGDIERAGLVALMLTAAARHAIDGPCPLFAIDANVRGAGKSLAADAAGIISTGRQLPRTTAAGDDDEFRKRITATLLAGEPMVLLDNVFGVLGCASFDAVLTARDWTDRILGQSMMTAVLPATAIWIATGNNLQFAADTARRTLRIRLESKMENPETRTGFKHENLLAWVRQERGRLASAAVTLLRAWHNAQRPGMGLTPWGTYEAWSRIVRAAVVWLDLPDPGATRQLVQRESDREAMLLRQLLNAWNEADPSGHGLTVVDAMQRAEAGDSALAAVFTELAGKDGKANPRSVGGKLRHLRGRVCDGRYFDGKDTNHGRAWIVHTTQASDSKDSSDSNPSPPAGAHTHARAHAHTEPAGTTVTTPSTVTPCDHVNASTWRHDGGKAYCTGCGKFMGRLPQEATA